jgi:hypothetical protein
MTTHRLHIKVACTLALAVVAAATGTALAASQGSHSDIGRILFRLKANAVICAMSRDSKALICFRPANGATARLPRKGIATASLVKANRGVPPKATSAPVLLKGHTYRISVYRCTVKKADVRCTNARNHGFQIGKDAIYRF